MNALGLDMLQQNKVFCHSPWTNVDITPQGTMSPCCKFRYSKYNEQPLNINKNSIDEYLNSTVLDQVKQDFNNGHWPAGCERCKIEEDNNIESKRQLDFQRWEDIYKNYDIASRQFVTASVVFGNTCNLKCLSCNPWSSSLWQKEYNDIYMVNVTANQWYHKGFVSDLLRNAPNLSHIDISGGEPFLSGVDQQLELLLEYVKTGQSANMTLHYNTNVTIFPDSRWWALWENFKEVDMQLSLDGVGSRAEYLRYPCNWQDIDANVSKYVTKSNELSNFRLSVSHTLSAYNIYYLDEFFTWCYNKQLPRPWVGRVHSPECIRPGVWPEHIKQHIIEHMKTSQHPDVTTWAQLLEHSNDSKMYDEFKKRIQQHDQYRHTDFKITFPELAQYI